MQNAGQIFRYAIAHGYAKRNPASEIRPADVLRPTRKTNLARIDVKELPALLRSMEVYQGTQVTRCGSVQGSDAGLCEALLCKYKRSCCCAADEKRARPLDSHCSCTDGWIGGRHERPRHATSDLCSMPK